MLGGATVNKFSATKCSDYKRITKNCQMEKGMRSEYFSELIASLILYELPLYS